MRYLLVVAFFTFTSISTGCSAETANSAMATYFVQRQECLAFTDELARSTAKQLSEFDTVHAMRNWLAKNREGRFPTLVDRIQSKTKNFGKIDLLKDSDQLRIFQVLQVEIQYVSGYDKSSCGPDVREYVAQALYLNLGGPQSAVAQKLNLDGIIGSTAQSRYLLAALISGSEE